ncbi:DUF6878 family protein [Alteraurantiacibacter buctensis]|uniref:DUF6878 domain-containing protein n=1 Tax=Alteraurantiacibacter buctensis TaxID=1503981 RepID=A0A844Z1N7_9SPHN|nr:DUF6878 family protein [Alteraurantiacibacter buctensis]MXO71823.1 hypothetical protein [Alteraurantiacibacter buctensis]
MNDLTTMMAEFASHLATRQIRVADRIGQLEEVLIPQLRAGGIAAVEVTFDGAGDSGAVEDVLCLDAAGATITCPSVMLELPPAQARAGNGGDEGFGDDGRTPQALDAALEQLTYLALERHHPGWENNDGAYGQLVIDVAAGTFALDCSLRFIATDDHSTAL